MRICIVVFILTVLGLTAQTRIDLRSQARNVDFSTANATKPFKTGTVLPATCSVGEGFFKSDAAPGANWYGCTAPNLWSVQSGSGGASRSADLTDLAVTRISGTVLSVAAGSWGSGNTNFTYDGGTVTIRSMNLTAATNSQPIRVTVSSTAGLRNGDTVTISGVQGNTAANGTFTVAVPNATQMDLVGSTGNGAYTGGGIIAGTSNGSAYIYGGDAGYLVVEHAASAALIVSCTGRCIVNQVPSPEFAANSVPASVAAISGGNWLSVTDSRRFMSNRGIGAGLGISVNDAGGMARVSVDATVARIPGANTWTGPNSFTAATRTAPFRTGSGNPGSQNCVAGDTYWQLDATAGENLWGCMSTGNPGVWQMLPRGSASRTPILEEEFITASASPNDFGQYHWRGAGDNAPVADQLTGSLGYQHPGVYSISTNAAANSTSAITLAALNGTHQFVNLGGTTGWALEAVAVTDSAMNGSEMGLRFGLSDNPASVSASNAIQIRYNNNTGCAVNGGDTGYVYENRAGGSATATTSPVFTAAAQSVHLRARSVTAGTVLFSLSINGGAFTAETAVAGAPAGPLSPFFSITTCNGTAKKLYVDYFRFTPGMLTR